MIVAEQMQNAVDQQARQLVCDAAFAAPGLALKCVDGDDDITQQIGIQLVGQRKRQDVSRCVEMSVQAVQPVDRRIRYERHAQLRLRAV